MKHTEMVKEANVKNTELEKFEWNIFGKGIILQMV